MLKPLFFTMFHLFGWKTAENQGAMHFSVLKALADDGVAPAFAPLHLLEGKQENPQSFPQVIVDYYNWIIGL